MLYSAIKNLLPHPVKHPLLACNKWSWDLRGFPAQSPGDLALVRRALEQLGGDKIRVFEWGSGRSTLYYSKFLMSLGRDFSWTAMDNSPLWYKKTRQMIWKAGLSENVQVWCSEFPAFWELPDFSYSNPIPPRSYIDDTKVLEYVNRPQQSKEEFDLIFVDGRYRRRCLIVARTVLAPQGIVILHDAQREHYHSSLSAYPQVQFLETGVFTGTRQMSTVALCGLGDNPLIGRLAEKYQNLETG